MERAYHKWFSPMLGKEMELLVFGGRGVPVIFFPTRGARFYDFENWKVIEAMRPKIEAGELHILCVDSIDNESFYSDASPEDRILRHLDYENYILKEVIPFIKKINPEKRLISAGCSLGGYHAVNIAFRHPSLFTKVVGMSARYDLTVSLPFFKDLFDGYFSDTIYYNMPTRFIAMLSDKRILRRLRKLEIILVIGQEDSFLENNKELSSALKNLKVAHDFFIWNEEAHRPRYWREMVKLYL